MRNRIKMAHMNCVVGLLLCFIVFSVAIVESAQSAAPTSIQYNVSVLSIDSSPILSYVQGTSTFQQVFNVAWIEPSPATKHTAGLLVRSQNCSASVGGPCVFCSGPGQNASVLTAVRLLSDPSTLLPEPLFAHVTESDVVFGPASDTDLFGTEDPRLTFDPSSNLYYLFYTAYGKQDSSVAANDNSILLSLATTTDPFCASCWTRHGAVFPSIQGSKSGALLIRPEMPHYLLWGDTQIRIAASKDLQSWPDAGSVLLSPRADHFDSTLVESGPNPLMLSTGDYLFLYNSEGNGAYHVGWVVLSGSDPSVVLARSSVPLLRPDFLWEQGVSPWTCNVGNVVFLQGIARTEKPDVFRVFFGGADAVVGTALIEVQSATTSL